MLAAVVSIFCASSSAHVLAPPSRPQHAEPAQPDESAPMNLLWDGIDILDADDDDAITKRFGSFRASRHFDADTMVAEAGAVGVEVIGLQDTGTNLLSQLLYKNFKRQIVHYDSTASGRKHGVWKHANMQWVEEKAPMAFENLKEHGVIPLVVIRNPLSWLQSIKKAPYELAACVKGEDWLTRACTHKVPAGYVKKMYNADVKPWTLENLPELWGQWTQSYGPVLARNFHRVVFVKYEDLVLHTEAAVTKIGEVLNVTVPTTIDIVEDPAKNHGKPAGHEAAMAKIMNKEYLDDYTLEELYEACQYLTHFRDLMDQYDYDDCAHVELLQTEAH